MLGSAIEKRRGYLLTGNSVGMRRCLGPLVRSKVAMLGQGGTTGALGFDLHVFDHAAKF